MFVVLAVTMARHEDKEMTSSTQCKGCSQALHCLVSGLEWMEETFVHQCAYCRRIRILGKNPLMYRGTWIPGSALPKCGRVVCSVRCRECADKQYRKIHGNMV